MADAREESSEESSDSTSSDNFSIYTETSSSEEDLRNVEEPGTSTWSATTHNSRKGKSKSSSKQPTVKRSKRQQSFFAGKAYLKINSLVKTPLHEFMAVARSGLWAPGSVNFIAFESQRLKGFNPQRARNYADWKYYIWALIFDRGPWTSSDLRWKQWPAEEISGLHGLEGHYGGFLYFYLRFLYSENRIDYNSLSSKTLPSLNLLSQLKILDDGYHQIFLRDRLNNHLIHTFYF